MLMALKSLSKTQQTAGMHQYNLSLLYCSYIRYSLLNILLFSVVLSLDHELHKIIRGGTLYTILV